MIMPLGFQHALERRTLEKKHLESVGRAGSSTADNRLQTICGASVQTHVWR